MAIELSTDHKPSNREEKERIIKKGGTIERLKLNDEEYGPLRVWADDEGPGIAMTRTLGDLNAKKIGLISDPEIKHIELKPGDRFIVIASDGVWDVMKSAEVVGFILKTCNEGGETDVKESAEKLVRECRRRWDNETRNKKSSNKVGDHPTAKKGIDDITAIIAYLNFKDQVLDLHTPFKQPRPT